MANIKIPPPPPNFKFPQNRQPINNEVTEKANDLTSPSNFTYVEKKEIQSKKKVFSEKGKKILFFFLSALCFASSIVVFTLMFV